MGPRNNGRVADELRDMHLLMHLLAVTFGRDLPAPAGPGSSPPPPPLNFGPTSASPSPRFHGPSAGSASPAAAPRVVADASSSEPLALIDGGRAAPGAWLAVWRGEAWVCWNPGPGCWQRLDLLGKVDVGLLRAEFTGPTSVVLGDRSEATWRIDRGDPIPRTALANPVGSPRPYACGPIGPLPVVGAGGLGFVAAPCPEAAAGPHLCVARGRGDNVRPVAGLRVRLGLELRREEAWQRTAGAAATTGFAMLAILGLGWDSGSQLRRERADLQAQARPAVRTLPALRSRGPLAAAEREALTSVLCGGAP